MSLRGKEAGCRRSATPAGSTDTAATRLTNGLGSPSAGTRTMAGACGAVFPDRAAAEAAG